VFSVVRDQFFATWDSHIGGVTPSRPTRHARPCSVPSGCFAAMMKTFAPGFEVGLVAWLINDNGRIGGHEDFLFSVLVFQRQRLPIDGGANLLDICIGHRALRPEIPRVVSFSGSAHCLGKDMHFERAHGAVRLRHGGDPHE